MGSIRTAIFWEGKTWNLQGNRIQRNEILRVNLEGVRINKKGGLFVPQLHAR